MVSPITGIMCSRSDDAPGILTDCLLRQEQGHNHAQRAKQRATEKPCTRPAARVSHKPPAEQGSNGYHGNHQD